MQLDENTFVLAVNDPGTYRFFCKAAGFSSKVGVVGLARIFIPTGCRVDGDTISMVPSPSLFFNLGKVRTVDLDSLKDFNHSATAWAVEQGEYHVDSGISGPSMGDVMKKWKVHNLKEQKHYTLMDYLHYLAGIVVLIVVCYLIIVLVSVWRKYKQRRVREATRAADNQALEENIFHRLRKSELFRRVRAPASEHEMEEIARSEQPLTGNEENVE